jgi:hypothetical protein
VRPCGSSAGNEPARILAAEIGRAAVVAIDNRDALRGVDAVVLTLRFAVLNGVIDEIADPPTSGPVLTQRVAGRVGWPRARGLAPARQPRAGDHRAGLRVGVCKRAGQAVLRSREMKGRKAHPRA